MQVEIKDHYLYIDGARVTYKRSPNISNSRNSLQYLIEHYTATYGASSPIEWLTNKESQVSAHLVVGKDGTVTQLAAFDAICWHSGVSEWKGLKGMNSYSIGIEIVNSGILTHKADGYYSADGHKVENYKELTNKLGLKAVWEVYPDIQIETVAAISKALKSHYNLKEIIGHEDISPRRKTDPGPAFPWDKIVGDPSVETRRTTSNVNLRVVPSLDPTTIIEVVPKDSEVKFLSTEKSWSKVEFNGKIGYIISQYLK